MDKQDLKKVLRPLIKECVREIILEETGILSKIVNEVATGLRPERAALVREREERSVPDHTQKRTVIDERNRRLKEQKKNMLNAIGQSAYNGIDIFEGTTPLQSGGVPNGKPSETAGRGPMRDVDPSDPGIDLSAIPGFDLQIARKLMG